MVLETFYNDKLNIKSITLEEPKQKETLEPVDLSPFLTEEFSQHLINNYDAEQDIGTRKTMLAVYIAILFPEKLGKLGSLDSRWGKSVWRYVSDSWKDMRRLQTNWYALARDTREGMILFPDKMSRLIQDNTLTIAEAAKMRGRFSELKEQGRWKMGGESQDFAIGAALKLLAPDQLKEPLYTSEEWNGMLGSFEAQLRNANYFYFFTQAINMKLLSQGTNLEVNLPPEAQQLAQHYLEEQDRFARTAPPGTAVMLNWMGAAEIAAGLKVIQAGDVELTNRGLKLGSATPKQSFEQTNTPELPEIRKF